MPWGTEHKAQWLLYPLPASYILKVTSICLGVEIANPSPNSMPDGQSIPAVLLFRLGTERMRLH